MSSAPSRRADVVALLITLAFLTGLVSMRQSLGAGWGQLDVDGASGAVSLGLVHSIPDSLSYVAWAQQAMHGQVPFSNLYTTEAHEALMVIPLFWLLGKLAGLLALHPLLLLNVAALLSAGVAVLGVYYAAREIGFRPRTAYLAMGFTVFGAGLSVPLFALSSGAAWSRGADTHFLDLFPATAFPYYPYQSIGYAVGIALLCLLLRSERALRQGSGGWRWLLATFTMAFVVAAVRPYDPVSFLIVYGAFVALTLIARRDRATVRTRIALFLALAVAMLPVIAYYRWVSAHPVWAEFAALALDRQYSRAYWLVGFGLFWPAAAYGAVVGLRDRAVDISLLALWAAFLFALLVVANRPEAKLAGSGFVALALLSALAVDDLWRRLQRLRPLPRAVAFILFSVVLLSTLASPTGLFVKKYLKSYHPGIEIEVVLAARQIRAQDGRAVVTVLSDFQTSNYLPALAGFRVYAGHWALTLDVEQKIDLLAAAGFEWAGAATADGSESQEAAMARLLAATRFDYVLVRKDRPAWSLLRDNPDLKPVHESRHWALFEVKGV